ncbi:hypothetical protein FB45DRAFT_1087694 [Roridomyces roridus]|uniref:Uncharacterized protein n=1 Tax=Roridomyces roridus TaxID=1738132 RepID=A0AAD7F5W4_9AGAR|nr:hypothetical protein FB45DRAFT_1087694 [Roridomyces roridus]
MTVMTRKMHKEAGLPSLPTRLPTDVPKMASPPRPRNPSSSKKKANSIPVARSQQRIIAPPTVLSSPTRFDSPSPLSSCPSSPSARSTASSTYFTAASSITEVDDMFDDELRSAVHPGVLRAQRKLGDRWKFAVDGETVRMYMPQTGSPEPPVRKMSLGQEWARLGTPTRTYGDPCGSGKPSRESSSYRVSSPDGTARGTPISSRGSPFSAQPTQAGRGSGRYGEFQHVKE